MNFIKKIDKLILFGILKLIYNKLSFFFEKIYKKRFLNSFEYEQNNYYNFKDTLLSKLSDKYGCDKGYNVLENRIFYNNWHPHNYTDYYSSLFDHTRENIKKVFECGIGTNDINIPSSMGKDYVPGASLKIWRDYFPNANIYGADIDTNILFESERIKTFYVNQLEKNEIERMWNNIGTNNFDLMIDDGLHSLEAGICLFENSYDKLREGGIYIIEDVDPSYLNDLSKHLMNKNQIEVITLKSKKHIFMKDNNLIIIRK